MVRRLLNALVQRVRHDASYIIDPDIATYDAVIELLRRGGSLARAQWVFRGVAGGRLRFAEKRVSVRHRRHCRIGRGSVVEAYARLDCLGEVGVELGERVTVGKFCLLEATGVLWQKANGIRIGDDTGVGDFSFIGGGGGVTIGRRVLMGQRISIHSENHVFTHPDRPIKEQGVTRQGVHIGDDCWLGAGVIVLDGVQLGAGCVVAAGAVVTRSFPDGSVVAGVPARLVRSRKDRGTEAG